MSDNTKTYQDHLNEAKKNSKIKTFIKLSQDPLLVQMDKLVRSHAKSHFDAFPKIDVTEEETRKQYADFCRTRNTDNPIVGDKIKPMAEYWLMRRELERYISCWKSCLDHYCDDVVLFG
jgi:hypothetical protein